MRPSGVLALRKIKLMIMGKRPNVKIQLNVTWLRVLVIILIILQLFDPNKAWMIVLVGFGGIWLLSFVWCRQLAYGLRLRREQLYGWRQVGDWLEERFTLSNYSLAPATWVSIEDSSDLPGCSVSVGTGIGAQSERRWMKRTPCERRGEYHLGPLTLKTGDIFGIYSVEIEYSETTTFMVIPPVIHLPQKIQAEAGCRVDESKLSRIRTEKSIVSIGAREYVSGDNFAKIHWMITAKKDEPYVRLFENINSSDSWWILLDLDQKTHVGEGNRATDENSIILAASLADLGLRAGKSVGLIVSGEELIVHPLKHGADQRSNIFRSLSHVQRGSIRMANLLALSQQYLHQYGNCIVVTSSSQIDWIDKLDLFRAKHINPVVMLVASDQHDHHLGLREIGELLAKRGVTHHLLTPELFATPEARPGHRGEIKWKFTPMGRAIMIKPDGGRD
ncbi:DUF58 domain-containing protein [Chloroflexota bacterium]